MASAPRLAARCPNCHTAFRVVADQLRLRGGLVRCGRCNHVFDGRAHLIELSAAPIPEAAQPSIAAPAAPPHLPDPQEAAVGMMPPAPAASPEPKTEAPAQPPATEDDHGFGMTLIWEEDIAEEGVAEVHLGEVEGATPIPDAQSTAPDTRPLPDESSAPSIEPAPPAAGQTPEAKPVVDVPTAAPAAPADPFHGLPPILELEDDEDTFAAAVPKQPSADLPVEPLIAPVAAPMAAKSEAPAPAPAPSPQPAAEKHDSVWMRHETDAHTLFAPVPRRHGNQARRAHDEHAGPTPQRTLTGAPRPRKARGPNHGVSAATLDFLRAAQAREQVRKSSGRRAMARIAIGFLAVVAVAQVLFLGRAEIARRVPSTRPLWEALCQPLHCKIAPPRDLDALQIESSQLQRQEGDASDQYVLTATLHNRASGPVALPAIELVTTDLQDQLLSRRALLPADYLNPADRAFGVSGMPARAELPIRVRFQSQRPTANYRVLIFYP